MMKRATLATLCLLVGSTVWAGLAPSILPASNHYQGRKSFFVSDAAGFVAGHVEFAVYDTQQQALAGYSGSERYVYAYQVFTYATSTAPLTYFSLLGGNFSGLTLQSDDALGGATTAGVSPTGTNATASAAIWDFADGSLIKGANSWFLFFRSNSDWVAGSVEVKSSFNDDLPVNVPEPATMALFAIGTILSIRRKRQ
jgi:hypothetical protein